MDKRHKEIFLSIRNTDEKTSTKETFSTIKHPIREGRVNTTMRYQHTQSQMAKNKMVTTANTVVDVETDYLFITSGTKKKMILTLKK